MKYYILILAFLFLACDQSTESQRINQNIEFTQNKKSMEADIRQIMGNQQVAWNSGNLDHFMIGYWETDSLRFVGKNGITKGYKKTLDQYKKSYPDRAAMGTLAFDIIQVDSLSFDHQFVLGKWTLFRAKDTLSGHYSLLWEKFGNEWKIVLDHSS